MGEGEEGRKKEERGRWEGGWGGGWESWEGEEQRGGEGDGEGGRDALPYPCTKEGVVRYAFLGSKCACSHVQMVKSHFAIWSSGQEVIGRGENPDRTGPDQTGSTGSSN